MGEEISTEINKIPLNKSGNEIENPQQMPKGFPSAADITAVADKKACFYPPSPGFIIKIANDWANVLRSKGEWNEEKYDNLIRLGFQGHMHQRSDMHIASQAVEQPILDIAAARKR